jgi:hypothetical protein
MTDAQNSRTRRIVRRIVLSIAIPALLLSGYVGSYLIVKSAACATYNTNAAPFVRPMFDKLYAFWIPILSYERSDLPLSTELRALDVWCWRLGTFTWSQAHSEAVWDQDFEKDMERFRREKSP